MIEFENSFRRNVDEESFFSLKTRTKKKKIALNSKKNWEYFFSEGRQRIASASFQAADAIIYSYLPGPEAGNALARVLFGDVNPSGTQNLLKKISPNFFGLFFFFFFFFWGCPTKKSRGGGGGAVLKGWLVEKTFSAFFHESH